MHKLERNFEAADEIGKQLFSKGVRFHDKLKQWRAHGGIFEDVEGEYSGLKIFRMPPERPPTPYLLDDQRHAGHLTQEVSSLRGAVDIILRTSIKDMRRHQPLVEIE